MVTDIFHLSTININVILKKFQAYVDDILSERNVPKPLSKLTRGPYKKGKSRLPGRVTDKKDLARRKGKAMTNVSRQPSEEQTNSAKEQAGGIVTNRKKKRGSKAKTRMQKSSIKNSFIK